MTSETLPYSPGEGAHLSIAHAIQTGLWSDEQSKCRERTENDSGAGRGVGSNGVSCMRVMTLCAACHMRPSTGSEDLAET